MSNHTHLKHAEKSLGYTPEDPFSSMLKDHGGDRDPYGQHGSLLHIDSKGRLHSVKQLPSHGQSGRTRP